MAIARTLNWFKEWHRRAGEHGGMIVPLDLRGLPPPEPMLRLLERIEEGEGPHAFLLPFAPTPLYPLLASYGWKVRTRASGEAIEVTLTRDR